MTTIISTNRLGSSSSKYVAYFPLQLSNPLGILRHKVANSREVNCNLQGRPHVYNSTTVSPCPAVHSRVQHVLGRAPESLRRTGKGAESGEESTLSIAVVSQYTEAPTCHQG